MLCPTSTSWSRAAALECWIERATCDGQILAQLRGSDPKRLPGGIEVEPELVVIANLGIAPQVVEHLHPGNQAGPEPVDHQHGDLVGIVRLQHVQALDVLRAFAIQQTLCGTVGPLKVGSLRL